MLSNQEIAQKLSDLPRWVEVRDLLLSDSCEILALEEAPELSLVLRDLDTPSVFVIGKPSVTAIQSAIQPATPGANVVAPQENGVWLAKFLPEWNRTRIIVHVLSEQPGLPQLPDDKVRFLDPQILPTLPIPPDLLEELQSGAEHSPIAATFVENQPVSFCYAGSITESLWDVSIDTLPQHYRRGYAALCAAYMIRHMQAQGKQPVWQAVVENPASWRLAQKLAFVPVDELAFFEPRQQASSLS